MRYETLFIWPILFTVLLVEGQIFPSYPGLGFQFFRFDDRLPIEARYTTTRTNKRPPLSTFTVTVLINNINSLFNILALILSYLPKYSTSTHFVTATSVVICTTSTAAILPCSSRKKRSGSNLRGLFYNEDDFIPLASSAMPEK